MACIIRPLIQFSRWRGSMFSGLVVSHSSCTRTVAGVPLFSFLKSPIRGINFRSHALKVREVSSPSDNDESDGDSSSESSGGRRSRNERKREARRAVRWGMELAEFSPYQIKRILKVADLDQQVFDALILVKRLGRDVREGKRRQFNYIGGLLREVEPELMDGLIQATKDGNHSMFQELSGNKTFVYDDAEEVENEVLEEDDDEEDSTITDVLSRWCDGLINRDVLITKEVYALQEVEFDRQKLRQLVRKVQSTLQHGVISMEENVSPDVAAINARESLSHFLRGIVKELPS